MLFGWVHPSLICHSPSPSYFLCHLFHIRVHFSVHNHKIPPYLVAVHIHRALQLCKQPTQPPFLINTLDPNGPVRRLNLDLIALPFISPDQVEITDKASPRGAALTELGRIMDDRISDGDAAVVRGDG